MILGAKRRGSRERERERENALKREDRVCPGPWLYQASVPLLTYVPKPLKVYF